MSKKSGANLPPNTDWQSNAVDLPDDDWRNRGEDLPDKKPEDYPGMLKSAAYGLVQGTTLNHGDEIIGGLQHPVGGAKQFLNTYLNQKYSDQDVDAYKASRNQARSEDEAAKEAHPYIYGGAQGVGMMAPAIGLGVTGAEAVPIAASLAGMSGMGSSRAEDPGHLALDASLPTVAAAGIQGGMSAAGDVIKSQASKLGEFLQNKGGEIAENATEASPAMASRFKGYYGTATEPKTGKYLLEEDLVPKLGSRVRFRENVKGALGRAGQKIGDVLDSLTQSGNMIRATDLYDAAQQKAQEMIANGADTGTVKSFLDSVNQEIGSRGPFLTPEEVNSMSQNWEHLARYSNKAGNAKQNMAEKAFAKLLNTAENENAASAADKSLHPELMGAKNDYGYLKPVDEAMAKGYQSHKQGTLKIGMKDLLFGGLGGALGGAGGHYSGGSPYQDASAGALGGIVAGKALQSRGPGIGANLLYGAGKGISGSLPPMQEFGRAVSPAASALAGQQLANYLRSLRNK